MAAPAITIYKDFFDSIQKTLDTAITQNLDSLIPWLTPIVRSLLIVYIAIWGIQHLTGTAKSTLVDGFFKLIKITFIIMFALKVGEYNGKIVNLVMNGPDQISAALSGGSAVGAEALDQIFAKGKEIAMSLLSRAGITDFSTIFQGLFGFIGVFFLTGCAAIVMLLAKVGLCVLLSLGPIFIVMALFEPTKKWFDSWVGQIFNFSLLLLLVHIVLNIGIAFFKSTLDSMPPTSSTVGWSATSKICLLSYMLYSVFKQLPGLASGLSGGFQLGTAEVTSGLGKAGAAAGGYAAGRTAALGRATGGAAVQAYKNLNPGMGAVASNSLSNATANSIQRNIRTPIAQALKEPMPTK